MAQKFYLQSGHGTSEHQVSTVLCGKASVALGTNKRTVWFDKNDDYSGTGGGDFAAGQLKGGCHPDEYVGGVAFTTRTFADGSPSALLCVS
ncbi:hypothetical protein C8R43DRAFT_1119692 [Mycena crocata]|nr:hypothetical protein C8R43DRAFT_1119692 [Mycena crocata]